MLYNAKGDVRIPASAFLFIHVPSKSSIMEQSQPNEQTEEHVETNDQPSNTSRQHADDKSKQDADEKLPPEKTGAPSGDAKDIHDTVRGEKLEEKYRGGDTTDAEEAR